MARARLTGLARPPGREPVDWILPPDKIDDCATDAPSAGDHATDMPFVGDRDHATGGLSAGDSGAAADGGSPPEGGRLSGVLPEALRGARLDPGRRGVVVLVVVALIAAAVAGISMWRARPSTEPLAAPIAEQTEPAAQLIVAVAGKVRKPGVVRLPPGARVADAVAAAGGALPGADLASVNLARKVVDGEQVVVGAPVAEGVAPPGAAPAAGGRLNLNTATVEQLDALPGVGPVLAKRLVEYRTAQGGFRSVDQLREVDGIGESRFQKLKELVTA